MRFAPALILLLYRQTERERAEETLLLLDALTAVVSTAVAGAKAGDPIGEMKASLRAMRGVPEPPPDLAANRRRLHQHLLLAGAGSA